LHTWRALAEAQLAAPGEHTRARQMPPAQVVAAAQGSSVHARPRASQVRARSAPTHSAAEGVHACGRQVASAAQPWPGGQSVLLRQSTQ
jgi:hypothetical protein